MLKQAIKVWPFAIAMLCTMAQVTTGCANMGDFAMDETDFWDGATAGGSTEKATDSLSADTDTTIERADTIDCAACSGSYGYTDGTFRIQIPMNGGYWEDRPTHVRLTLRNAQQAILVDEPAVDVAWTSIDAAAEPDGIGRWSIAGYDATWYDDGEIAQATVEFEAKGQIYTFNLNLVAGDSATD